MHNPTRSLRRPPARFTVRGPLVAALSVWGVILTAGAQEPRRNAPPAFFLRELEAQLEQFADRLFRQPTPAEEEALAAITITPAEEQKWGEQVFAAYKSDLDRQQLRLLRSGRDVEYLKKLVAVVQPHMRQAARYRTITVYVVDAPGVDARSFPGGTVVFYQGLLSFAESEAAVVGVIGHELSHIDRGHLLLPLKRSKLLDGSGQGESGDWQRRMAGMSLAMRTMSRPFRPQDEAEADRDGAAWALAAGYDPRDLARLFDRLAQRSRDPKFPFASFFRSHPYSEERRDAILATCANLPPSPPAPPLYRGTQNLTQRIPRSTQSFSTDLRSVVP